MSNFINIINDFTNLNNIYEQELMNNIIEMSMSQEEKYKHIISMSQIFKDKVDIQILIDFLDRYCTKTNNMYEINNIVFKKAKFESFRICKKTY